MDVAVHQFPLTADDVRLRAAEAVLAPDELARFSRMAPPVRRRGIVARATLRCVLAERLGIFPRQVSFAYGPFGKPELAPELGSIVRFNLAHSGDLAVIAIGEGAPIGIDLEEERDGVDYALLAPDVFSTSELSRFRELPADQHKGVFFRTWTGKEAFVKATGEGLSRPFPTFEVEWDQERPMRMLTVSPEWTRMPWLLRPLATPMGFAGALAVGGCGVTVRNRETPVNFRIS